MKPKQDENGFWYFDKIPSEFRLATEEDYHQKLFTPGKAFLIKSILQNNYECHRVKANEKISPKILEFIIEDRVYIFMKNQ